jgi:hypothetical protein
VTPALLARLTTDEFALSVGFLLPAPALRRALEATAEVQEVRAALADGRLTDETVREFVTALMRDLQQGQRFSHDLSLAALAVALEHRPTPFAEEYLLGLSRLELAELSTSIRIARECSRQRRTMAELPGANGIPSETQGEPSSR